MPTATPCLFCEIIAGAAAQRVWEDAATVAFLDIRPVFPGHTLVVPRHHVETLSDLPALDVGTFFATVRTLAQAIEEGLHAGGTFVAINNRVSQSVPHMHCHIVPRTKGDGLRGFFWPRNKYASDAEAADYAQRIATAARIDRSG